MSKTHPPYARPTRRAGHRDQTTLEPSRIDRAEIHNHPLGATSTLVSEKDFIPSAIVHLSAGDDSPKLSTELA